MAHKIPVYDVQTFYGTHQKTFQKKWNAKKYFNQLRQMMIEKDSDPDLVEMSKRELDIIDFCYEYIED